jgi:NAD(P)H dehydrogenase (quinone)
MTIVVTGATGQYGRLVVEALLKSGVPPHDIVATGRDLSRIGDLADQGVLVRSADYNDPATLLAAFEGADRALLVPGNDVGQRVPQHHNVITAAKKAGVSLLAYASIANADHTGMSIAADHRATEEALAGSDVPYVLLRNSWYLENYTAQLAAYLEHGVLLGSAGDGRVSAATRADYAEAAAAVLLRDAQAGSVYELGGDQPFTLTELAAEISEATGREVTYRNLGTDEHTQALITAGIPEPYAAALADSDLGIARGDLLVTTGDLAQLISRPITSMREAVHTAASAIGATA